MTRERIERAIEVIDYAVKNGISVKEASKKCGFADTYVKNVKRVLLEEYNNGTLEDELFSLFMDAYQKYEKVSAGVQLELGINGDNVKTEVTPGTTIKTEGDKAEIETRFRYSNKDIPHIKTVEDLLKECEVKTDLWEITKQVVNKWDVTSWKNYEPETIQNFQIKVWLERIKEKFNSKFAADLFVQMVKEYKPPTLNIEYFTKFGSQATPIENNLLEISLFDLHLGKLAWGGETGENYDTKIARERFLQTIQMLLHRATGFEYSKILFPIGNDFFNSDTIFNTTTKGTPQDEDLRWQKTFRVGTRLVIDAINLLKQTGVPVDVMVIQGNHDFERSFYLGEYLCAWFNNDKQVNVNNGASPRKYYKFGNVLLGFTHGSEEKEGSLPLLMATDIESKPMWSDTKYHEWHVGHIHRKRNVQYSIILNKERTLNEDLGVTVRYLSSLTGTEEWHHKKGFVGAIKAGDAFIWNDELGLVAHLNSNFKIE